MRQASGSYNGMVVTPHHLASQAGLAILREGGNAVEAVVAAAAALAVVYPHMTGLGGDGFWMIHSPSAYSRADAAASGSAASAASGKQGVRTNGAVPGTLGASHAPLAPVSIDASGRSAALASREWYAKRKLSCLPKRGPLAAMTMAGAVSGWQKALEIASTWPRGVLSPTPLPLARLLEDARALAEDGYPVSPSQYFMTKASQTELAPQPGFAAQFLPGGRPPAPGSRLRLPVLAETLRRLGADGLESFYHGPLARDMAADLEAAGSPLRLEDFTRHQAHIRPALSLRLQTATLYNTPPPTQGMASLLILGLTERFAARAGLNLRDERTLVHAIVEATKQAFRLRDVHLADPDHMVQDVAELLSPASLDGLAAALSPDAAAPWPHGTPGGDTVWLGAADHQGNMVSYIQSIYHEFGSGLVLPRSGIAWNNRGLGFVFGSANDEAHPNCLAPEKRPFHTLNPALAVMDDGRLLAYGTMGGEGQPQTQAAVFIRHMLLGMDLQEAVSAPRWLLGRAWGDASTSLKLEAGFHPSLADSLRGMGHIVEETGPLNSLMGHAGAILRRTDGLMQGAADPRSDGSASCW